MVEQFPGTTDHWDVPCFCLISGQTQHSMSVQFACCSFYQSDQLCFWSVWMKSKCHKQSPFPEHYLYVILATCIKSTLAIISDLILSLHVSLIGFTLLPMTYRNTGSFITQSQNFGLFSLVLSILANRSPRFQTRAKWRCLMFEPDRTW